ncbi:MAG: hypothetical protein KA142_09615 [Chromatiaceae bacterium]|nr:hypothetical protein [Chromatiaceae bacterium]MBP9604995.1 hypothetical protein [Chromatiaceae bacterium]
MTELFTAKRWTGEFFLPDSYEKRFFGEIQYSPEEGVILSYTIAGHDVPAATEVLHGVLSSGDKCTLIGRFDPHHAGFIVDAFQFSALFANYLKIFCKKRS